MHKKLKIYLTTTDWLYLCLCTALSILSVVALISVVQTGQLSAHALSGQYKIVFTQLLAICLGIACALAISAIPFHKIASLWPYISIVCWAFVLLTFIPGIAYSPGNTGSQSWISAPFGMSFQPTEFAKIAFFISFATHLDAAKTTLSHPKTLFGIFSHILLPVLLVHFQGDDGAAAVFLATGLLMLFLAGLNRWVVIGFATAGLCSLPILWKFILSTHQKDRILGMLFPQEFADTTMYQQIQSRAAISSGGLLGKGFFTQNHLHVPLSENDFIFSYLAQCLGFIGILVVLFFLFAFLLRTLKAAACSRDRISAYFCGCVFVSLLFQSTIHIGMNLMLLPVMGLTLPFLSAGGSSMLTSYICVGLVLSIQRGYLYQKSFSTVKSNTRLAKIHIKATT